MYNKSKKLSITIVLIIIISMIIGNATVLSLAAESGETEQPKIVTINEDSNGKQINLLVGQLLLVELDGKKFINETEFCWELSERPNNAISLYKSFKNQNKGKECWVFNACGEGAYKLGFISSDRTFIEVSVTVKKEMGVVYAAGNNSKITLIKGQKLKIMLPSNATTGYSWNQTGLTDSSILKESSKYYVSYPTPPGWAGGGGTTHLLFESLGVGSTKIELKYARSWQIEETTEEIYTIDVNVIDNNDNPEIIKINEESNGKEIIVTQGKIIKVELNNQDTENKWELASALDKNIMRQILSYKDKDLGKDCLVLMTKGDGTQDLKFILGDKSFIVKVIVKQPKDVVFIDEEYNGKEVVIKKGDTLILGLEGNGSTGNAWLNMKSSISDVISLGSDIKVPFPVPMGWTGVGYMQYLSYKGESEGTTSIALKYSRGWDSSDKEFKTFSVKVRVTDDQTSPTPYADICLYGYVKTDGISTDESKAYGVNKGYTLEIDDGYRRTYTDENGRFDFGIMVLSNNQVYKVKITKGNCLERIVDFTCSRTITMWPGDIAVGGAQDKCINFLDVMAIAKAFNAQPSEERYNADCDLNCDGYINMADVIMIAKHFNAVSSDYGELR